MTGGVLFKLGIGYWIPVQRTSRNSVYSQTVFRVLATTAFFHFSAPVDPPCVSILSIGACDCARKAAVGGARSALQKNARVIAQSQFI